MFLYDETGVIRAVSFKKDLSAIEEGDLLELSSFAIKTIYKGIYDRIWYPVPGESSFVKLEFSLILW